jgi:hypothetical protein
MCRVVMAVESSRLKRDCLKYNFRANIRSPMFFVKQFSSDRRLPLDSCLFRVEFEGNRENRAAKDSISVCGVPNSPRRAAVEPIPLASSLGVEPSRCR